jgi:hypothetical protein
MLAARLLASAAEDTARREQETARLHKRLRKIDAAETAHAREIENLASLPQGSPAITALRTRIIERFGELETERTEIGERLAALDRATGQHDDPALLDNLPFLGDILAGALASLQARLFAAFGLELIYNKADHQFSIYATITPRHPRRPRRHHRRQRATRRPRRDGRIGPFSATLPPVMVAPTIAILVMGAPQRGLMRPVVR